MSQFFFCFPCIHSLGEEAYSCSCRKKNCKEESQASLHNVNTALFETCVSSFFWQPALTSVYWGVTTFAGQAVRLFLNRQLAVMNNLLALLNKYPFITTQTQGINQGEEVVHTHRPTSSYMKSGSELLAKRSVLIRVCSENTWLRKASPKGGSIPLTLGYNKVNTDIWSSLLKGTFSSSAKHKDHCHCIQVSEICAVLAIWRAATFTDKHAISQSQKTLKEQLMTCNSLIKGHIFIHHIARALLLHSFLLVWNFHAFAKFRDMLAFVEEESE